MSGVSDRRSRLVSLLKFVLPLAALGLLSMLFLLARPTDPERAIPYADVDVAELSKDERVTAPAYSGMTRDGAAIMMVAQSVRTAFANPTTLHASTVTGRVDFVSGSSAELTAPAAVIDTTANLARFMGGVTVLSSDGYRMDSETLVAALGRTEIVAETPVRATGPIGQLDAGSMRIVEDDAGGHLLVFNDGVRLVYDPRKARERP